MDKFEYGSLRLKIVQFGKEVSLENSKAVLTITADRVEEVVLERILQSITDTEYFYRPGGISTRTRTKILFDGTALEYMEPYLNKLGQEGWEVVAYKCDDTFGEALLKRKVQED